MCVGILYSNSKEWMLTERISFFLVFANAEQCLCIAKTFPFLSSSSPVREVNGQETERRQVTADTD